METTTTSYPKNPQTKPSVWTLGAKGGLITGLVLVILTLVFQFILGYQTEWWIMLLSVIAFTVGIIMTHKEFKKEGDGYMAYSTGLGLACVMGVVAGLVAGLFSFIYVNFIDPTIAEKQADAAVEMQVSLLESMGGSDADIDKVLDNRAEQVSAVKSPLTTIGGQMISSLVFAFFLSLIVSAFTKRTDPTVEY